MRPNLLILILLISAGITGPGQVVVHDPINAQIAVQSHIEELLKLIAIIEQVSTTKDWLGNAGDILDLAGVETIFTSLQTEGIGHSRIEIAATATTLDGTTYAGDGLYAPVEEIFVSRSGQAITRPDVFKPESAIFSAVRDHDAVYEDVKVRRAALRQSMQETLHQLQTATTHAEVLKASGVLMAQNAELEATDRELEAATQKALLLDLQNRADQERQVKARQQEQAVEFAEALTTFTHALRPPSFVRPTQRPQP